MRFLDVALLVAALAIYMRATAAIERKARVGEVTGFVRRGPVESSQSGDCDSPNRQAVFRAASAVPRVGPGIS